MSKPKPLPKANELFRLFKYCPDSGVITRRINCRSAKRGELAGWVRPDGYTYVRVNRKEYAAHRIAWAMIYGDISEDSSIDHINGNRSDNRLCNLRICNNSENQYNAKTRKDSRTGLKGVKRENGRYAARIGKNGKRYYLGSFDTPELAHMAYCKAAAELHGEFARGA